MLKSQIQMGALSRQEGLIEETKASISKRIESTKTELNELKKRLAQEQVERSHREEYEEAAKLINKLPTRAELQGQIDKERAEFEAVQKEEQKVRIWFSTSPPQGGRVRVREGRARHWDMMSNRY